MLGKDLDSLEGWAVENGMEMNTGKSKAIIFTRAWVKNPLGYCLGDQKLPEASRCKFLGVMLRNDLNWVDQLYINYQLDALTIIYS